MVERMVLGWVGRLVDWRADWMVQKWAVSTVSNLVQQKAGLKVD